MEMQWNRSVTCAEQMTTSARDGANKPSKQGPRVLVVEDNPLNAKLVLAQLEQGRYLATSVESGEAALAVLTAGPYSLVLMDCGLPRMDGIATTREIRKREGPERHTIVVGLSSNTAEAARATCLAAGMDGYIERPVTTSELLKQLELFSSSSRSAATSVKETERPDTIAPLATQTLDPNVLAELAALPGTDGNPLLAELAGMFLSNLPGMIRDLSNAERAGTPDVSRAAHRLKSAATTIGAKRLAAVCKAIQEDCEHDERSRLKRLLAEVPEEAGRLAAKLKEIISAVAI